MRRSSLIIPVANVNWKDACELSGPVQSFSRRSTQVGLCFCVDERNYRFPPIVGGSSFADDVRNGYSDRKRYRHATLFSNEAFLGLFLENTIFAVTREYC